MRVEGGASGSMGLLGAKQDLRDFAWFIRSPGPGGAARLQTARSGDITLIHRQDRRRKPMNIRPDQIWTGTLNDLDAVQKGFDRSKTVRFYDTTLRDGEQSTGVCFSANDKFRI